MNTNDYVATFLIIMIWIPLTMLLYFSISGKLGVGTVVYVEVIIESFLGISGTILTYRAWNSFKKKIYGVEK